MSHDPGFLLPGWLLSMLVGMVPCLMLVLFMSVRRARVGRGARDLIDGAAADARRLERERILHELHDTFLQSVQMVSWQFRTLSDRLPQDGDLRASMASALEFAESTMAEGREILFGLQSSECPPPFMERLRAHAGVLAALGEVELDVVQDGDPQPVTANVNQAITRIAGEALSNAFRHAGASRITLRVQYSPGEVCVCVHDDGKGLPGLQAACDARQFGMVVMKERARAMGATLRFEPGMPEDAGAGRGTTVRLSMAMPPVTSIGSRGSCNSAHSLQAARR